MRLTLMVNFSQTNKEQIIVWTCTEHGEVDHKLCLGKIYQCKNSNCYIPFEAINAFSGTFDFYLPAISLFFDLSWQICINRCYCITASWNNLKQENHSYRSQCKQTPLPLHITTFFSGTKIKR